MANKNLIFAVVTNKKILADSLKKDAQETKRVFEGSNRKSMDRARKVLKKSFK